MMSSHSTRRTFFAVIATLALGFAPATAQDARQGYVPPARDMVRAVAAEHGMVVAQEKLSAQIGADVLRRGGNAVDAAVATGFAMAVTYPRAGNIGGGGFMVIHSAERNEDIAIDLSRDRAGRDHAADLPRRGRQARHGKITRFSARHRRARHRRGPGPGIGQIRLGPVHAGATARTPPSRSRATASSSATISPIRCRAGTGGWHAGLPRPGSSRGPMARRWAPATGSCRPTLPKR